MLPAEIAARYAIERELGRGATAVVYLARDQESGRMVALKVLRPELAESLSADRFLREIRVTQQLAHPHIASVLDSGVAAHTFYCALRYMESGTLRDRFDRERQLPLADVTAIARAIGGALEYAHSRQVIHRDVKPENILFGGGQACLADFGIARALETAGDTTTSTGVVRGTPAYMSPEQASGERDYDGRSDLYSLACVLYEAIAGMPAFVGPNAQAVLAQRLLHVPRPVRVYRAGATVELESVLARALAIAPADRYQSAAELTDAFCRAIEAPGAGSHGAESITAGGAPFLARRRVWLAGAGVIAVGIMAALFGPLHLPIPFASRVPPDTTRIAIFPIQLAGTGAEVLARGLQRWRGIRLADQLTIDEALRRRRDPVSRGFAAALAERAGAGRYVLVRVDTTAVGTTVYATLYDVRQGQLYHAQLALESADRTLRVYAALADSLLLRGEHDEAPDALSPGSRDLVSTQLMIRAQHALDNWDLARVDSLFAEAAQRDTISGRPSLWLAQVREWASRPSAEWLPAAEAAGAKLASLAPRERIMARALIALGTGDFASACASYQTLIDADSRSFAGWYGIGECHEKDHVIVPDRRSPSKWRFRSSYQRALDGYVTAFKLLPATYRGFQANAYERLRALLFVSSRLLRRGAATAGAGFYASPILDHDTLVFVPVPERDALSGQPVVTMTQVRAAVRHLRDVLHTVAANWALAAPTSAGAKEALAISLELNGDPAAVDSLAVAQRLATDPVQRLRLAVMRAYVELKLGMPAASGTPDSAGLVRARRLADSLLSAPHGKSVAEAELLAPMAALTGRCRDATRYLQVAAQPLPGTVEIPRYLVADEAALLVHVTLGCSVPSSAPSVAVLASRLAALGGPDSTVRVVQYNLLSGIVRSQFPLDSVWVSRLASTSDFLLAAERDYLEGRRKVAAQRLGTVMQHRRGIMAGDLTPDAVLPEARMWLVLGDTSAALTTLASTLDFGRNFPPMSWSEPSQNVGTIGSLVGAMALRAELVRNDRDAATRWGSAVAVLWAGAAPELQPLVRQMRAIASH